MKSLLNFIFAASVLLNIILIYRWQQRDKKYYDFLKLKFYKDIPFEIGFESFKNKLKLKYPKINLAKYSVIYIWDSTSYFDHFYKNQIKSFDSLANISGELNINYCILTEMEENTSINFLNRNALLIKNSKSLYEMDDFISGIHNIKNLKLNKPITLRNINKNKLSCGFDVSHAKQRPLFLIIDSNGKIMYVNGNKWNFLHDTTFINMIKTHSISRIKTIN